MNVLFAIKNQENLIDTIVHKYQQDTNKRMNVKIVKSFTAIIRELQENKNYDRIIISENIVNDESNILKKVISISQKAKNTNGNLIPIIFITSSNRDFKILYESNVFNGLSQVDATKRNIYELIKRPRNKKDALEYYRNIGNMEKVNNKMKSEKSVENKVESNNNLNKIINYLNRIDLPDDRYIKRFDKIYDELDKKQIAVIIKSLTTNTKKILRKGSSKYKNFIEVQKKAKIEENQDTPKRGRGRPRKVKLEEEEEIAQEKRGRGRPRKLEKSKKIEIEPKNQTIKIEKNNKIEKNEKKTDKKIKEEKPQKHIENKIKSEKVNKNILNHEVNKENTKNIGKIPKKVESINNKKEVLKKNFENKNNFDEDWDFEDEDLDENSNLLNTTKKSSYEKHEKVSHKKSEFNDFDEDDGLDFDIDRDLEFEDKELKQKKDKKNVTESDYDLENENEKSFDEENNDNLDFDEENEDEFDDIEEENLDLEDEDEDLDLEEEDKDLDLDEEDDEDLDLDEEDENNLDSNEGDKNHLDLNKKDNDDLDEEDDDDDLIDLDDDISSNDDDLLKVEDNDLELNTHSTQFNGIKNKNYNPNYNISKQISEINGEDNDIDNKFDSAVNLKVSNTQRIAAFVGSHGNGTSFVINNIAQILSEQGIKTAILDLTKNKNSYYIYTENEEKLRNIAYSCFEKLKSGIVDGIKINKNLDVFTALPYSDNEIDDEESILKTLLKNYSLILIDCDFETKQNIFELVQEIYLVQSLDVLTIQPLTSFLKKLKMNKGLDEDKIKIIINKAVKVNSLNEKMIVSAMSVYNSPDTTYQLDLFNRDKVQYIIMPFEEQNYSKYLEQLIKCKLSARVYSKGLKNSLNKLGKMIYPIDTNKKI